MGLRLGGGGRRGALSHIALTAVGVAVGVTLVLLTLTVLPALQGRDHRGAWHATSVATPASAPDAALWLATGDHYLGRDLWRVQVAALGSHPPVPPGLDRLPGPGEVAVSSALRDLLAATPADTLADRLPGRVTAVIAPAGLATPDELVAVIGRAPDQLRELGAEQVSGIETSSSPGALANATMRVLVTIGAVGLLVPVLTFIAMVTRVAAGRREQRFAALRLVGATRAQVAAIAVAETSIASLAGVVLGWLGYLAARTVVAATVTFDGGRFMPDDVRAPTGQLIAVLMAVPVLAATAAVAGLRRAQVSPLGTRRRTRARRPGWWRLTPVAIGVAGLVTIASTDYTNTTRSSVTTAQMLIGTTFGSLLLGLVLAGPLLCSLVARLLSRASRRLPELMAARRIAADPYTTFRAISGVALAALVTTMFAGTARGVDANLDRPDEDALRINAVEILLPGASADLASAIAATPGVRQTVLARHAPGTATLAVSCAELAAAVNVDCATGLSAYGRLPFGLIGITHLDLADETLPVHAIYAVTDDDPASGERIRTRVATLAPAAVVSTGRDLVELDRRQLNELEGGLRLAMMFVVLVAAASLTVGVAAGLIERRRPFALLRATGVHVRELQRMVLLETALPMIATTVLGVALGLATSAAVSAAMGQRWSGPGPGFALTVVAGVVLALAVSSTTLPLVRSATEHDAVRFE
jgi:hypothetical protein